MDCNPIPNPFWQSLFFLFSRSNPKPTQLQRSTGGFFTHMHFFSLMSASSKKCAHRHGEGNQALHTANICHWSREDMKLHPQSELHEQKMTLTLPLRKQSPISRETTPLLF